MANLTEAPDLSFEDIDALLQKAEQRLKDAQQLTISTKTPYIYTLPKLKTGAVAKPYVKTEHGIAKTETQSTVSESQRRLAEKPRKIEDPVLMRERKKKKGMFSLSNDWRV
jgi:hypothetical protein